MAPNEHLLDNFSACKETRTLAGQLLREAQVKTAAGSGYEIRGLTTGLPAVCILIASERLNNGDVTRKAAQAAACLKPKDFSKVYTQVQAALETSIQVETSIQAATTTQSPSFRPRRKNEPMRELPSKNTPKKRQADELQTITTRSSSSAMVIERPLVTNTTPDLPSSSEESEVEDLPPPRRFRPVYLDCKQWNARDPRLARIWKKAETHKQALIKRCGHPLDRYRHVDVEMDQDI